jgi:polysaccharide transporter, PST family
VFFFLIATDAVVSVAVFGTAYGWRHIVFDGVFEKIRFLFKNGWPLLLTGLSALIFIKIDQVMVFHLRTAREAGSYASMIWLVEKTFIPIGIVMTAFFPYLSAQHALDRGHYLKAVRVGHKLFSLIAVPMVVFLIPNRAAIVTLLFGRDFSADTDALVFLGAAIPFIYWGAINQRVLVVTNALKLDLLYASSSAVLNLTLNYLLIPRYGTLGAGIAMVASHSFYFWAQFLVRDYRNYNFYMLLSLPLPLLASLVGLLLSRLLPGGIIVQALAYAAVYAGLIVFALRAGISEEYATLSRLFFTKVIGSGA